MIRSLVLAASFVGAAAAVASAETTTPPALKTVSSGIGEVMQTADGHSLYVYDRDTQPGVSECLDKCAAAWPPLPAAADATAIGDWTPIARPDGAKQWAYRGKPLYTFARDAAPGATLGDGVQDIWHVAVAFAPRPRAIKFQGTILGRVAATTKGMTLYVRDGKEPCVGKCLQSWTPLFAPWSARAVGDWTIARRSDDGTQQWAYKDRPVYSSVRDTKFSDVNGEGVDKVWHAVVLQPRAQLPSWVTLQPSDYGPIFATAKGMTLYTAPDLEQLKREATCDDACFAENWTPVTPGPDDKSSGNWTIVPGRDGKPQWAYRGQIIYTYNLDKRPSQIAGANFANGSGFGGFRVLEQRTLREEAL